MNAVSCEDLRLWVASFVVAGDVGHIVEEGALVYARPGVGTIASLNAGGVRVGAYEIAYAGKAGIKYGLAAHSARGTWVGAKGVIGGVNVEEWLRGTFEPKRVVFFDNVPDCLDYGSSFACRFDACASVLPGVWGPAFERKIRRAEVLLCPRGDMARFAKRLGR